MNIGAKVARVDGRDKITGRAKFTDDLVESNALIAKIYHSTIANGLVKKINTDKAMDIPGVVKILTCFDVPDWTFPTAGHPWSTEEAHQDPMDRKLLNQRVRLWGDDVAVVVAEDEIAANRGLAALEVEYEEYTPVLNPVVSMKGTTPLIHEESENNIFKHTKTERGNFDEAILEKGLIKIERSYQTPIIQHCHMEVATSYAYMEGSRITVVAATQIPHIVRRIIGQALGIPWGKVRVIKPYIGGGFGNRQDALYEPLNAWVCTQVGGRLVKMELTREETFFATRTRHAIHADFTTYVRPDGRIVAREGTFISNQGAYASHGHSIVSKCLTAFNQLYIDEKATKGQAYSVYTNTATAGAMRGYGTPQSIFAIDSHMEEIAAHLNMDPIKFRMKNIMPVGYTDGFSKNVNYFDTFNQCVEKGRKEINWDEKRKLYQNQTGPIRRGIGMSIFWYNTAVWPIALECSACRLVLNQDGSVQLQLGETEIGQGSDTIFSQMVSDTLGIPIQDVHMISTQDTDVTPFSTGAYGSRQTYLGGMAVKNTALELKNKILKSAYMYVRMQPDNMDIVNGNIIRKTDKTVLMSMSEFATRRLYDRESSEHITAESTTQCKSNAYSFGCAFAEIEVDMPLGQIKVLDLVNVHDCGQVINPQTAEAQVHGGQSMALGHTLSETLQYDEKTGKPLNPNLLDYKLPTTLDQPDLRVFFIENYEPTSAYGTKALGEPPVVPVAPAIRNALYNATGVFINEIPLRPHVLIPAFKKAGLIQDVHKAKL